MKGKIIKGIAGFYYVYVDGAGVYACRAKGIFRKLGLKPLVGDDVTLTATDEKDMEGNVTAVLPRKNALIRPAVANVDQALVIFAMKSPDPNGNLLDRFLLQMKQQSLPVIICFNKTDLAEEAAQQALTETYRDSGAKLLFLSAKTGVGLEELKTVLEGRTTTVAGPSGAGKSTIINLLQPEAEMETGDLSKKLERGRHTTRHAQLIHITGETFIMDTPGFSSLMLPEIPKEELRDYYPEFEAYEPACRFRGCSHVKEQDCGVRAAVADGRISAVRYENYRLFYEELKERKTYE